MGTKKIRFRLSHITHLKMNDKIKIYSSKELLQNDSFLRWKLYNSAEDRIFWETYIEQHPQVTNTVDDASHIIKNIVKLNDFKLTGQEVSSIADAIQQRLAADRKRKKKFYLIGISTAAACVLFAFFLSDFFSGRGKEAPFPDVVAGYNNSNPAAADDIQMIIGDDEVLSFDKDTDIKYDEAGNITVLNDRKEVAKVEKKEDAGKPNKLIVPNGKRSSLILADGTKVWINSGSTLEFPNVFKGDAREIKVDGEIYIEVATDAQRPFLVHTSDITVRVLGTRFNVSSYKDDDFSDVVLVEGKVEVICETENVVLLPDQLATIQGNSVEIKNVNVYDYISWKDGLYQFNSESLSMILKRISRYYNKIITLDENIASMTCTGKLVLFDDINTVLETISNTVPVKYEINSNNEILIREK